MQRLFRGKGEDPRCIVRQKFFNFSIVPTRISPRFERFEGLSSICRRVAIGTAVLRERRATRICTSSDRGRGSDVHVARDTRTVEKRVQKAGRE